MWMWWNRSNFWRLFDKELNFQLCNSVRCDVFRFVLIDRVFSRPFFVRFLWRGNFSFLSDCFTNNESIGEILSAFCLSEWTLKSDQFFRCQMVWWLVLCSGSLGTRWKHELTIYWQRESIFSLYLQLLLFSKILLSFQKFCVFWNEFWIRRLMISSSFFKE